MGRTAVRPDGRIRFYCQQFTCLALVSSTTLQLFVLQRFLGDWLIQQSANDDLQAKITEYKAAKERKTAEGAGTGTTAPAAPGAP